MEKTKDTQLDDVLGKFSVYGCYHLRLMLMLGLAYVSNSMYCSNYVFAAEEVVYRCKDENFGNNTCSSAVDGSPCTEWIYDDPHSFVAEFQLACQEWKRTLVGTIHSLGYMVGLLIVGPLSDRVGRKNMIVVTGVLGGVLGLAKSFSPSYWLYIFLEFWESAIGDICSPAYVLNIEFVATKKRVLYYTLCGLGYTIGGTTLPYVAWAVPYWRNFLQAIYAPALLFFLYLYLLDESPRWLLTQRKKEKAIAVIERAANTNKIQVEQETLNNLQCNAEDDVDFWNLLKITFSSKTMMKRFIVCVVWWTTSCFVSYGMMINSVSLQGNKHLNFALIALVDLPGNFIIMYILMNFKRRNPLIASFLFGAVMCFVQPFVPTNLPWLSVVVYMISKLMSTFYFTITYIYTSELFPTYTRNSMHALCSSLGRVGSIVAPQTPLLMAYWVGLPTIVFGSVSLVAGLLTFLVPDTASNSLPDTVLQAEALEFKKIPE